MPGTATNLQNDNAANAELREIMLAWNLSSRCMADLLNKKPFRFEVAPGTVQSWLNSPGTLGYENLPVATLGLLKDKLFAAKITRTKKAG